MVSLGISTSFIQVPTILMMEKNPDFGQSLKLILDLFKEYEILFMNEKISPMKIIPPQIGKLTIYIIDRPSPIAPDTFSTHGIHLQ